MLFGREAECVRLDAALEAARERHSSSLVLRGEAGIGKTALLDYAVGQANGFRVLRVLSAESEAELSFAAVQELVNPIRDLVPALPPPQARALRTALALEDGPAQEALAVSLAVLSLLAAASDEQPLLCVVDDAHWLDRASAEALTFVARRLQAEEIVLLFAAREPETAVFDAPGVPDLTLAGLRAADAKALLASTAPDLSDRSAARLVELTGGNPLALLEIPRAMSPDHRAGRALLDERLPVGSEIQRAFVVRANALSSASRRALLLVAAGDQGDADALWDALATSRLDGHPIAEAEAAGLLFPGKLQFCHPLARSAIYQSARPADRRAAHAALAAVTTEPDRRAWQRAAAAEGPDEDVAAALEEAAALAGRRGGAAAEARALEQAARLTEDADPRARRLLKAAFAAEAAGWLEHAGTLLAEVTDLTSEPAVRVQAVARHSYLLADRGEFDRAYALAVEEAERAAPGDAANILSLGALFALTHRLDVPGAVRTAERAWELAASAPNADLHVCENLCRTLILAGRSAEALALVREGVDEVKDSTELAVNFGTDLLYLEEYDHARRLLETVGESARDAGALGFLYYALDQLAKLETRVGNLTRAYALELESLQIAEPLRNEVPIAASLAWLATIEAMLGRTESRDHALRALGIGERRRDGYNIVRARAALGLDALARGDAAGAVDSLVPAATAAAAGGVQCPNFFRLDADLIEALARLGREGEAEPHLARLEAQSEATATVWGRAAAARCRAFLSPDAELDDMFGAALELHDGEPSAFERARTSLCYGERLRRAGRRRDARVQLRQTLEAFERLAAEPWADRARVELAASGEHIRRRDPTAAERMTSQELQIALVVSEGLSNRDVAARLFLSPKTVEFHLTHIYRKLEIHSRSELVRHMVQLEEGRDPAAVPTESEASR